MYSQTCATVVGTWIDLLVARDAHQEGIEWQTFLPEPMWQHRAHAGHQHIKSVTSHRTNISSVDDRSGTRLDALPMSFEKVVPFLAVHMLRVPVEIEMGHLQAADVNTEEESKNPYY
jgi:hypothetical protein